MVDNNIKDKKQPDADMIAFYEVMRDVYNQRYKIRSWVFKKILQHMQNKIHEESTIYYLMQEIAKNRLKTHNKD